MCNGAYRCVTVCNVHTSGIFFVSLKTTARKEVKVWNRHGLAACASGPLKHYCQCFPATSITGLSCGFCAPPRNSRCCFVFSPQSGYTLLMSRKVEARLQLQFDSITFPTLRPFVREFQFRHSASAIPTLRVWARTIVSNLMANTVYVWYSSVRCSGEESTRNTVALRLLIA